MKKQFKFKESIKVKFKLNKLNATENFLRIY